MPRRRGAHGHAAVVIRALPNMALFDRVCFSCAPLEQVNVQLSRHHPLVSHAFACAVPCSGHAL